MSTRLQGGRFAFPAMLFGSALMAFGPWMVRMSDVGPLATGFWRLFLAVPLLLVAAIILRQPLRPMNWQLFGIMALGGLAFAFDLAAWHEGLVRTRLANAALLGNATAFIFAAWGFFVKRQWPGRSVSIALALAFAGVVLLVGHSYQISSRNLLGDILCLLAAVFYTFYLIAVGFGRGRLAPLPSMVLVTASGAVVLLGMALFYEGNIWPTDWTPLLILAISSQVLGQGLLVYAVAHLEPVVVGLCFLVQPIIAGVIGWLAYSEHLGAGEFAGAVMVGIALVLVRRREPVPAAAPNPVITE